MWNTFADKLKLDSEIPRIMNEVFKFEKITKVLHIARIITTMQIMFYV